MEQVNVPIKLLPGFLDMKSEVRKKLPFTGVPCDSTNNELADWIWLARITNNKIRVAIKGDGDAKFPVIKQVISTVQDKNVYRFNLITSSEKPE